jgi:hypothetical protein
LQLVKAHWLLQTLAFFVMGAGGAAVYMNKDKMGYAHFTTTHSWVAGTFGTLWTLNLLGVRSRYSFYSATMHFTEAFLDP